jgi:phosphoribosylformylglycinamidine synthase
LTIPVKHGEGCWFADDELLAQLDATDQIALRYADGANPNGAVADVAGVLNADGNVFGLMPHPEHAVDALLGSTDGALILGSLVDAARSLDCRRRSHLGVHLPASAWASAGCSRDRRAAVRGRGRGA